MSINEYQFAHLPHDKQLELQAMQARNGIGLLNEEITALMLDVETSTLATWRSQSKGPDYVKLGKTVFYTVSSVSAWVNGELARQREFRKVGQ